MLVRANGRVQDLRLPLPDGAPHPDPDHPRPRRPGRARTCSGTPRRTSSPRRPAVSIRATKVAIGPPIETRLLLRLRVSRADRRGRPRARSRPRSSARSPRGACSNAGRSIATRPGGSSRPRASRTRSSSSTRPTGEISFYRQGDFTDLCRGPHLQNAEPIKAVKLTSLAGAYWRGDERNPQLTRIYGTAFYDRKDLAAHLERLEEAKRRDHRRLGRELDLVHFDEHSPGSPLWHPRGMVDLERARGPPPARERTARVPRGEDAAHLRHRALGDLGPLGEVPRQHVSDPRRRSKTYGLKPMNCPGHMLLFGSQLRQLPRAADPLRRVVDAPPRRAGGHVARAAPGQARDPGRRAHLLRAGADRGRDLRLPRLRRVPLRPVRDGGPLRALDPPREQARHRRGVGLHRGLPSGPRSSVRASTTC